MLKAFLIEFLEFPKKLLKAFPVNFFRELMKELLKEFSEQFSKVIPKKF